MSQKKILTKKKDGMGKIKTWNCGALKPKVTPLDSVLPARTRNLIGCEFLLSCKRGGWKPSLETEHAALAEEPNCRKGDPIEDTLSLSLNAIIGLLQLQHSPQPQFPIILFFNHSVFFSGLRSSTLLGFAGPSNHSYSDYDVAHILKPNYLIWSK